jgi:alpha-mannosidase
MFYSADAFGQAGTLPQILHLQGMDNFVFCRPGDYEKRLPFIFWWETPDGSHVLTTRVLNGFRIADMDGREQVLNTINQARSLSIPFMATRHGIGDHGGGPTIRNIRGINALMAEKDGPQMFYSTYGRFFDELRAAPNLQIPVVKDDLQHHAVGCYNSEVEIKKHNRRSETAFVTAEKVSTTGSVFFFFHCPKERFEEAW